MVISALSFAGRPRHRRGTVLPLVVLTLVAQLSFLALAIDLGMVAISKTQAQQAADLVDDAAVVVSVCEIHSVSRGGDLGVTGNGQYVLAWAVADENAPKDVRVLSGPVDRAAGDQDFGVTNEG